MAWTRFRKEIVMDSADLFRHLLTTKTFPEKTRSDYEFGFRTVFYIHGSSYCCCRCAYDHEYFTYISNTGDIDKDNFDKLAKAVERGYCEHAIRVQNKDYLKETKVYATHILAALGSEDMVKVVASVLDGNGLPKQNSLPPNRHRYRHYFRRTNAKDTSIKHTGLFELTPCDIGCLKHNGKALHLVDKIECDKRITSAEEIASNVLHFDKISLLQFCFRKQFIEDPMTVLDAVCADGIKYYELLFKLGLGVKLYEIIETLEHKLIHFGFDDDPLRDPPDPPYITYVDQDVADHLTAIGELSVIYNQYYIPRRRGHSKAIAILNRAIAALQGLKFKESPELPSIHATDYPYTYDCQTSELEIPLRPYTYGMKPSELEILLQLLVSYELSRDQVRIAMEQIPDLQNIINKRNKEGLTLLQLYICEKWCVEVPVVRTLIELGANIDMPLESCQSLLTIILNKIDRQGFREVLELLLYENISPAENGSEVHTAIRLYNLSDATTQDTSDLFSMLMSIRISKAIRMTQRCYFLEPGTYVMDATLHNDVFASTLPLLIEAGFKYSSSALRDLVESFGDCSAPDNSQTSSAESSEVIHVKRALRELWSEHVKEYLERCSSEPRPLMLRCRDVLRTRFPGRQIHRYVSVMDIPERISDFLLLKSILQRLPLDI